MTYSRLCASAAGKLLSGVQPYQIKKEEGNLSSPLCLRMVSSQHTHAEREAGVALTRSRTLTNAERRTKCPTAAEECTTNGERTVVRWQQVASASVRGLTLH